MSSTIHNVRDIAGDKKQVLEELLGEQLAENGQLLIVSYTPGVVPDEATRRGALAQLRELMDKAHAHATAHGVTQREADEAIDEAVRHIRYGEK